MSSIGTSLQKKSLMVMCLMSDDLNIFKMHVMMTFKNMAHKFGVMIKHQGSLFVLKNLRLQIFWSGRVSKHKNAVLMFDHNSKLANLKT